MNGPTPERAEELVASLMETASRSLEWMVARPAYRASLAKVDGSPVTAADVTIQLLMLHELRRRVGTVRVIAEESSASLGDDAGAWRLVAEALEEFQSWSGLAPASVGELGNGLAWGHDVEAEEYWSIDPIDGTSGWVAGRAYCTCIGLIRRGRSLAGGILMPPPPQDWGSIPAIREGLFLTASLGAGCRRRALEASRLGMVNAELRRGASSRPPIWLCSVRGGPRTERGRRVLDRAAPGAEAVPIDSQCKYGLVALGCGDVAFRVARRGSAPEQAWDHAAGMLVASEAGARTSDVFGQDIEFGPDGTMSRSTGTLACGAELHAGIVDAVSAEFRSVE